MFRRIYIYLVAVAALMPVLVLAQDYVLLSPLGDFQSVPTGSSDVYIRQLFIIFVAVAAVLAVIRLMICGIQYMTSESIPGKASAKTCIWYVLGGIFLILLSVVILRTINIELGSATFEEVIGGVEGNVGEGPPAQSAGGGEGPAFGGPGGPVGPPTPGFGN